MTVFVLLIPYYRLFIVPQFILRVIDAGRRCVVRDRLFGGATSSGAGYANTLDYDALVSFSVCEEALAVSETFSEGDIRYCFKIVDDRGEGRLDLAATKTLYDDLVSILLPPPVFYS